MGCRRGYRAGIPREVGKKPIPYGPSLLHPCFINTKAKTWFGRITDLWSLTMRFPLIICLDFWDCWRRRRGGLSWQGQGPLLLLLALAVSKPVLQWLGIPWTGVLEFGVSGQTPTRSSPTSVILIPSTHLQKTIARCPVWATPPSYMLSVANMHLSPPILEGLAHTLVVGVGTGPEVYIDTSPILESPEKSKFLCTCKIAIDPLKTRRPQDRFKPLLLVSVTLIHVLGLLID